MQQGDPPPAPCEEAAQHHERHEGEVKRDERIGKERPGHRPVPRGR